MSTLLFLDERDLFQMGAHNPEDYLSVVEDTFKLHAQGSYIQPLKLYLRWDDNKNRLNMMPSALLSKDQPIIGVKIVTSVPSNPLCRHLPRGQSLLLLYALDTGLPKAMLAGTKISAMRTAAISAVAAKHLANPNSTRVGLIGAGPISANHVLCLQSLFPKLNEVSVFDTNAKRALLFQKQVGNALDIEIHVTDRYETAMADHDMVIVATNTNESFIEGHHLTKGTFFSNVGIMEAHSSVIKHATHVVVDDVQQCTQKDCALTRALKENLIVRDMIHELGAVIDGRVTLKRHPEDIVFFNAIGMGMIDTACGLHFLEKAERLNLGQMLTLDEGCYDEFGLPNQL